MMLSLYGCATSPPATIDYFPPTALLSIETFHDLQPGELIGRRAEIANSGKPTIEEEHYASELKERCVAAGITPVPLRDAEFLILINCHNTVEFGSIDTPQFSAYGVAKMPIKTMISSFTIGIYGRGKGGKQRYQSYAVLISRNVDKTTAIPFLLDQIFTDFPGKSASQREERIKETIIKGKP